MKLRLVRHAAAFPNRFIRQALASVVAAALVTTFGAVAGAAQSSATPVISAVGGLAAGTGTSLAVSPRAQGDLMVLTVSASNSGPPTVSTVSGGGVNNWSAVRRLTVTSGNDDDVEIWSGTVAAIGASTIKVTMTGYSNVDDLTAQEFSAGSSVQWSVGTSNVLTSVGSPWDYPSLSPTGAGELYYGVATVNNSDTLSGGGTAGVNYMRSGLPLGDMVAYDPDVTGTVQPTGATSNGGAGEDSVAVLFIATSVTVTAPAASASTAPVISAVGGLAAGTGTSLAVSPRVQGDLMVLTVSASNSTPPTVSTVSGGGVNNWSAVRRLTSHKR